MHRVAAVVGALVLTTACTSATYVPGVRVIEPPTPVVRSTFGCTGCRMPSPAPEHACQPPLCHIVYATPRPTHRASRSRPVAIRPQPVQHAVGGGLHDITEYCDHGIMADGGQTHEGVVATIRRDVPFGTRVIIDGMGTYTVEDRIGHGSEYDIWNPSCASANDFGRHHLHVQIIN